MNTKITIQAEINASQAKVWDYYTQPEHIVNWNFAVEEWHCPSASNDLTVGGKYIARMEAKDGSFGFDFEAVYTELNLGTSFQYRLGDERFVDLKLEESNGTTTATIAFDAETENDPELQRQGWLMILNRFKTYTETN